MHVEDLSGAFFFLLNTYNQKGLINIEFGIEISIKELAELISLEVNYQGQLILTILN